MYTLGLRTLVVAKRTLTDEQYLEFDVRYQAAKLSVTDRTARVSAVVESLERDMELLSVTGVEDRLQVRFSLFDIAFRVEMKTRVCEISEQC